MRRLFWIYVGGPNVIARVLTGKKEGRKGRGGDVRTEAKVQVM